MAPTETVEPRIVAPTPLKTQLAQIAVTVPLTTLTGLQWVTWLAIANNVLGWFVDVSWAPTVSWWWILLAFIVFITPIGRMTIAVVGRACSYASWSQERTREVVVNTCVCG